MCLAVPAKIIELKNGAMAIVESEGVIKEISVIMIKNPTIGDFVIVHVGFALNKIDEDEAFRTFELIEQVEREREREREIEYD